MRILLLNLSNNSAQEGLRALQGEGHGLFTARNLGVDEIISFQAHVLIAEATPSDLSCCQLIDQMKSVPDRPIPKIVLIVYGGAVERSRALELGADEVVVAPIEPVEFSARIRTQIQMKQSEAHREFQLEQTFETGRSVEDTVEASSSRDSETKTFGVVRGVLVSIAALVTISTAILNWHILAPHNSKPVDARSTGQLPNGEDLSRITEQARVPPTSGTAPETRPIGKQQPGRLHQKIQDNSHREVLKDDIQPATRQLAHPEDEDRFAETVVKRYGSGVCLLHVIVKFKEKSSGLPLFASTDSHGHIKSLGTTPIGVPLRMDVFGTGFLVHDDKTLLTNHHVVQPWWGDDDLKPLFESGATAYIESYTAYFPGEIEGIEAELGRISEHADLATLILVKAVPPRVPVMEIDERRKASISGDRVILMGYPTGLDGILARAGSDVSRGLLENAKNVGDIIAGLATQHFIRPTTTQGHIGDVLKDEIVYDAATTSGGSGGPLFNREGKVIGVNRSILQNFTGSNMAVPIRYADELLEVAR